MSDAPYEVDDRGLHPQDSGYVYRVMSRARGKDKGRAWFKNEQDALRRAQWHADRGHRVTVNRYELRNVQQVVEYDGRANLLTDGDRELMARAWAAGIRPHQTIRHADQVGRNAGLPRVEARKALVLMRQHPDVAIGSDR